MYFDMALEVGHYRFALLLRICAFVLHWFTRRYVPASSDSTAELRHPSYVHEWVWRSTGLFFALSVTCM